MPERIVITVPGSSRTINVKVPGVQGPANTLEIGTVSTTSPGGNAAALITGESPNQTLSLTIPRGIQGPANSLAIGTVSTLATGASATADISGAAPNQLINLGLPRGAQGIQGIQGIQGVKGDTGAAGSGVPTGGSTGALLQKSSTTDYAVSWINSDTAATASTIAKRGTGGTLIAATATVSSELSTLGQQTQAITDATSTFGRDRGTGTALPNTDLRRGDQFYHTGLVSLLVYTGSALGWRQEHVARVADGSARVAISTTYSAQLPVGFEVVESDTGYARRWNGSAWMKSGGAPELLVSTHAMGTSGAVSSTSITPVRSITVPSNSVGGRLKLMSSGVTASGAASAATMALRWSTATDISESRIHISNNGVVNAPTAFNCEGYIAYAPGTAATTLALTMAIDSGSASMLVIDGSFKAYLEAGY